MGKVLKECNIWDTTLMLMEEKDKRYENILPLIKAGKIKTFVDVFEQVPRTKVSEDSRIKYDTLKRKAKKVSLFTFGEMEILAELFDVNVHDLVDLFKNEKR